MGNAHDDLVNQSAEELLQLLGTGTVGSQWEERIRSALYARAVMENTQATKALESVVHGAIESGAKLQRALVWFTAVIAAATVAGVLVAVFA